MISWNKIGDSSGQELLPIDIRKTYTDVMGNGSDNIILPNTPKNDTLDISPIALKRTVYPFTPDKVQKMRHAYYGEAVEVDEHLGEVLDELDRLKLWNSTIVVFWSDHGIYLGEYEELWLKLTLFEESLVNH